MTKEEYEGWIKRLKTLGKFLLLCDQLTEEEYFKSLKFTDMYITVLDDNIYLTRETLRKLTKAENKGDVKKALAEYRIRFEKIRNYLTFRESKIRLDKVFDALRDTVAHTTAIVEFILKGEEKFNSINVKYYITHVVKMLEVLCKENLKN